MDVISILQMREAVVLERLGDLPWSHSKKQKMGLIALLSHSRVHSPFYFLSKGKKKNKTERKEGKNNPRNSLGSNRSESSEFTFANLMHLFSTRNKVQFSY